MRWNILLVTASIVMLLLFIGSESVQGWMQAEAIAEELAPQIGIDEDIIRSHLERILASGSTCRTLVSCSPLALLALLLTARLVADVASERGEVAPKNRTAS